MLLDAFTEHLRGAGLGNANLYIIDNNYIKNEQKNQAAAIKAKFKWSGKLSILFYKHISKITAANFLSTIFHSNGRFIFLYPYEFISGQLPTTENIVVSDSTEYFPDDFVPFLQKKISMEELMGLFPNPKKYKSRQLIFSKNLQDFCYDDDYDVSTPIVKVKSFKVFEQNLNHLKELFENGNKVAEDILKTAFNKTQLQVDIKEEVYINCEARIKTVKTIELKDTSTLKKIPFLSNSLKITMKTTEGISELLEESIFYKIDSISLLSPPSLSILKPKDLQALNIFGSSGILKIGN